MFNFRKSKVRTEGHDSHMMPVKLGELDTDGVYVGYIDEEGLSWESREERDAAVGAGRISDLLNVRSKVSLLDSLQAKNLDKLLDDAGVLEENRYLACKEYINEVIIRRHLQQLNKKGLTDDKEN
jgi:hypothetical protein